jgi:microcystin degradation protein MlrC
MRVGVVGCFHETNTFAPGLTELEAFKKEWFVGKQTFYDAYKGTKTSMGGVIDASNHLEFELVPLFYTQTLPSSMVAEEAMEHILHELLFHIKEEKDGLDGLIVILHGAMVSEQYQDVEGNFLKQFRELLKDKPIAVTIDLHANVSEDLVYYSDIIVGYDTYPHIDAYDRAFEASQLLERFIKGQIHPTSFLAKTNLLIAPTLMNTNIEPMSVLMEKVFGFEKDNDVLNLTIAGGFAFADAFCTGATVIVTTDNNPEKAKTIAEQLSQWMVSRQDEFRPVLYALEDVGKFIEEKNEYPVVLIESSDNVGGGSPADATHILQYLIDYKVDKFLFVISDPEAVSFAVSQGINERFHCLVGGKTDKQYGQEPLHGLSVEVNGRIRLLCDGYYAHKGPYMSRMKAYMGNTAVIELDNTESIVVITEKRVAPWDVNHVKSVGIDPEAFKVIVVKAAVAWRSAFGEIAKDAIELDTPGACSSNLSHFQYKHISRSLEIIAGGHSK